MNIDFDKRADEIVEQMWADTFEKAAIRKLIRAAIVDAYLAGSIAGHASHLLSRPIINPNVTA